MDRRTFLRATLASTGTLTLGRAFLARASAAPAVPGASPYGPLQAADANGVMLPEGFTSRIIARSMTGVGPDLYPWKPWPDGAATFATDDGGWILVVNSENPPPALDLPLPIVDNLPQGFPAGGGVSAIRFGPDGTITEAYEILSGSRSNCAGGATPWGTWLSCEEFEADDQIGAVPYDGGVVYECDPTGTDAAVIHHALGHFKHENATIDPRDGRCYQSEDLADGLFYRFTPDSPGDLSAGLLEAAAVDGAGQVTWVSIDEPEASAGTPCRQQGIAKGATTFDGGEGCVYDAGFVFLTTKGDDRVWAFDVAEQNMSILYDGVGDFPDDDDSVRILRGVDHINVQPGTGNLVVAEDGGNLEAVMIDRRTLELFPILRLTGPEQGFDNETPIPTESEVTGLAFSPDGERLYFNSQRGAGFGITYEVTGPWTAATQVEEPTTTTAAPPPSPTAGPAGTLPETGPGDARGSLGWVGLGALGGAALAWRARRAASHDSADTGGVSTGSGGS